MSDPAIKDDVVNALKGATGVSITMLADGSYEIAGIDQPVRNYVFKSTVSRRLLWRFVHWYKVPIEAFFKSYRIEPKTDVSGR